ncbi:hypothetical protein DPMN_190970 [Dreissena polymorpha]|uniref:Uncharacterized protein n=1 Tax=Dreissena polymorpha TaxID=45954 RepID=A0A9D3Y4H4_DREPO|nr:hypothetical protein DPMN_190970 [Dreissena polymorpha]
MARQRPTRGAPGLIMGPCIVEIDRIVIRYVQYQFEANLGGRGLVMGPCIIEIDRIVIKDVQYQFEVSPCRNKEVIVKGNFRWAWSMWAGALQVEIDCIVIRDAILGGCGLCGRGAPGLVMGPCIVEIDCIVIRHVQYKFEVNRRRNKEVNLPYSGQDGRTDRRRR